MDDLFDAIDPHWRDRPTIRRNQWERQRQAAYDLAAALVAAEATTSPIECGDGWELVRDPAGRWTVYGPDRPA